MPHVEKQDKGILSIQNQRISILSAGADFFFCLASGWYLQLTWGVIPFCIPIYNEQRMVAWQFVLEFKSTLYLYNIIQHIFQYLGDMWWYVLICDDVWWCVMISCDIWWCSLPCWSMQYSTARSTARWLTWDAARYQNWELALDGVENLGAFR